MDLIVLVSGWAPRIDIASPRTVCFGCDWEVYVERVADQ